MAKDSRNPVQQTTQQFPSTSIVFISRRYVILCTCKCYEMELEGKKNLKLEEEEGRNLMKLSEDSTCFHYCKSLQLSRVPLRLGTASSGMVMKTASLSH